MLRLFKRESAVLCSVAFFIMVFSLLLAPSLAWADDQVAQPSEEEATELVVEVQSLPADDNAAPQADPAGEVAEPVAVQAETTEVQVESAEVPDQAIEDAAKGEPEKLLVEEPVEESVDPADDLLVQGKLAEQGEGEAAEGQPAVSDEMLDTGVSMHRLYNPNSGEHFYTGDPAERDFLTNVGWAYEGIGWIAPAIGEAVHRLYNPNAGDHHYTTSEYERDSLVKVGWNYEGVGWYSGGDCAVLRQYNPNAQAGAHNFTTSQYENDWLASVGWHAEGIGWYALAANADDLVSRYALPVATVSAEGKELQVESSLVDGLYYLLLPSYADLTAVRLSALFRGEEMALSVADWESSNFKDLAIKEAVNIDALSTASADNGARLLWCKPSGSPIIQQLAVMVSSAVSAVHVDSVDASRGRSYVESTTDHSTKADVRVTVVNADGALVYAQDTDSKTSSIKGRGNTTWTGSDKKPYQISLSKKADLLETNVKDNAQKKWVLLANAGDVTLLHDTVAYNLGLELGMVGGTECAPVDLYYDGEYRGSYLLCEKVQIGKGRVDIADLEDAIEEANPDTDFDRLGTSTFRNIYGKTFQYVKNLTDPVDISGGYLLEIDEAYYSGELCWFESSWGHIVVKSPEYCSLNAMKYISERFETAVQRLNSNRTSAEDGAVFDLDSLALTYAVNEFAKSPDAFYTSLYIYKDKGETSFVASPLWDFDGSMGMRLHDTANFVSYQGFVLPHGVEVTSSMPKPLAKIPIFQDRVRELWTNVVSPLVNNVLLSNSVNAAGANGFLHSLAYYRSQITASQKMDEVLWGLTAFNWIDLLPYSTYELNFKYLRDWLSWRTAWMDSNIGRLSNGAVYNPPWVYNEVDYGLVFDAPYYLEVNKDAIGAMSEAAALKHFCDIGMACGLVASRNFNVHVYRENNPDLQAAFGDDLTRYYLHFIEYGYNEARIAV